MSVHTHGGTMSGGVTPICDSCGVSLCWDISRTEYLEAKPFWDAWTCQDCNGSRLSAHGWRHEHGRESLPTAVEAVVTAFESEPRAGHSTETVCWMFAARLDAAGFGTTVETVPGTSHHVVRLGAMTIDWTADRHDADAPVPLVHRTAHGWPIEPVTDDLDALLAQLTPERRERLAQILRTRGN